MTGAGTSTSTKINTLRGDDGLWYDPNQLDGYLATKPKITYMNSPGAISALKELYSDTQIHDLVYKTNPLLDLAKK